MHRRVWSQQIGQLRVAPSHSREKASAVRASWPKRAVSCHRLVPSGLGTIALLLISVACTATTSSSPEAPPSQSASDGPASGATSPDGQARIAVGCVGACIPGPAYYTGHGSLQIKITGLPASVSEILVRGGFDSASRLLSRGAPTRDGGYIFKLKPTQAGRLHLVASAIAGGSPILLTDILIKQVTVSVPDQISAQSGAATRLAGSVVPPVGGGRVWAEWSSGGLIRKSASVSVTADGGFELVLAPFTGQPPAELRLSYETPIGSVATFAGPRVRWNSPASTATATSSTKVTTSTTTGTGVPSLEATTRAATLQDVRLSYRPGCPVQLSELVRIDLNYLGFDGQVHRGHLVVRRGHEEKFLAVMQVALETNFSFRIMQDPSAYGNDDTVSMEADNTYAFSCRQVTGNAARISPHAYGTAIDVNPRENPYRLPDGSWLPVVGRPYINRNPTRTGMLDESSAVVRAFKRQGFQWYSGWDWQHFQL